MKKHINIFSQPSVAPIATRQLHGTADQPCGASPGRNTLLGKCKFPSLSCKNNENMNKFYFRMFTGEKKLWSRVSFGPKQSESRTGVLSNCFKLLFLLRGNGMKMSNLDLHELMWASPRSKRWISDDSALLKIPSIPRHQQPMFLNQFKHTRNPQHGPLHTKAHFIVRPLF